MYSLLHGKHLVLTCHAYSWLYRFTDPGFPALLALKFQVISRFCTGQKGHSPGYSMDNFVTKRQTPKAF